MHKPLPFAIAKLSQDHIYMRMVINAVDRQVEMVAQYREPDYDVLTGAVQYLGDYPTRFHHPIEERICEALLRRAPEKAAEVRMIEKEHQDIATKLIRFAVAVRNALLDIAVSRRNFCRIAREFIAFERDHIRKEESQLFLSAAEHLTQDDWMEIDQAVRESHDPLFGEKLAARYERLRENIVAWDAEDRAGRAKPPSAVVTPIY